MPDCITSALVLSIPPEARLAADTETAPAMVSAAQGKILPRHDSRSRIHPFWFFRGFCFAFFVFFILNFSTFLFLFIQKRSGFPGRFRGA